MKQINLVYILGVSFSGSTLLGYLMGSSKNVWNLGELKQIKEKRQRTPKRLCTCEKNIADCPFWSKYEHHYTPYIEESRIRKLLIFLKVLFKLPFPINMLSNTQDHQLLYKMLEEDKEYFEDENFYFLDTSKSLWRLVYLMKCKNINLKVIYLSKEMRSNVASFSKRKHLKNIPHTNFWEGLMAYKLQHFLVKRFLGYSKNTDYITVDYTDLSNNPQSEMNKIGGFLKVDYANYQEKLKEREYHVTTGNTKVTLQFKKGFEMQKEDDKWKNILSPFQKKILGIVK